MSFGCALVVNKKDDTYVWVLQQLIEAGDGHRPLTVITDRDKAMTNAIAEVLRGVKHILCLWHIMRKVQSCTDHSFLDGFLRCTDKCRTKSGFERVWKELVGKHKVQGRRWFQELYEDKEKWAETYLQGYFYAVMRTNQRCKSMNRTLKTWLDRKVRLYRFVENYHKQLKSLRWEEGHQDNKTNDEQSYCDDVLASLKCNAVQTIYVKKDVGLQNKDADVEDNNPSAVQEGIPL
ncbi:protein FAR1-RELATED SEQUENCE 5-like [Hibiscus syriacus]|uniref:protein FAR1-RELATED SEQUENCE 5-like n=1 Tax=Hibiscus syriacus TaxID=106335 RepID=UPI001923B887|nr:protein FAR1-RELATED SEQUENCE 5-like [Hibiscus syriacus]